MQVTLTIPDEWAGQWPTLKGQIPQMLEREIHAAASAQLGEFKNLADVLELLARLPSPEEVLALRPSAVLQERIQTLLEKNRDSGLSPEEEREWERFQYVEHLVRIAKSNAAAKHCGQ